MSKITRDLEKINSRQVATANKRQQRELKFMEDNHAKLKLELEKAHEAERLDLREQNQAQIQKETQRKEKVLGEMKASLEHTTRLTEEQLKTIKADAAAEKVKVQRDLRDQNEARIAENKVRMDEMNERFNATTTKLNEESQGRLDQLDRDLRRRFSDQEQKLTEKIHTQRDAFETKFKQDGALYEKTKTQQDEAFEKERISTHRRNQVELSKQSEEHMKTYQTRGEDLRRGLKDQDLFFEKKFQETLARHNGQYASLNERHRRVEEKMKTDLTSELTKTINRSDDPFYKFVELKPTLTEFPDHVEIKVGVSEHAKQDLQLTTNGKEAILNFNRRYTDSNRAEDGRLNKISKVETFTTRLKTQDALEPRSIKSTYLDGVMTYIIKKA